MASSSTQLSLSELNEDHGYELISVSAVMLVLQLIAVGLRLWGRCITKAPFAMDDYLCILAMISGVALCCVGIAGAVVGHMGRHTDWVAIHDPSSLNAPLKFLFMIEVIQIPFPITLAKLSILAFARRIFPLPALRKATLVIGVVVVAHGLSSLLVAIFQCNPVVRAWDLRVPGQCIDTLAWARFISVPNILTDLALLALPVPFIWNTQTSVGKRVGLTLIFAMGSFNIVTSAIRMSFFFTTALYDDRFWAANQLHTWCILEASTAVIAACMPSAWPVAKRTFAPWRARVGSWRRDRSHDREKALSDSSSDAGLRGSSRSGRGATPERASPWPAKDVAPGQGRDVETPMPRDHYVEQLALPGDAHEEMGWSHNHAPTVSPC